MFAITYLRSQRFYSRLYAIGQEYENLGHYRRAEWTFRSLLQLSPPTSAAYYVLGRVQDKRGNLVEAKKNFAKALKLKPDFYLCRVGFFDICRREYWSVSPLTPRSFLELDAVSQHAPHLKQLHRLMRYSLGIPMRYEVARPDSDNVDACLYDRALELSRGLDASRSSRPLHLKLLEACDYLKQLPDELARVQEATTRSRTRRVRVFRRREDPVELEDFRDSDDLIGAHFEIIYQGRLSFVPMGRIRQTTFGLHSEFIEASLELHDESPYPVIIPGVYFGSRESSSPELQRGEFSIFKNLLNGIRVGVGRRVFSGRLPHSQEIMSIGIHDIQRIEFQ